MSDIEPLSSEVAQVVFFGDSITENWERFFDTMFVDRPYIARGIGGQTTAQMLQRFHQDVIGSDAKVVVILAGTNDIAGNTGPVTQVDIERNLIEMIDMSRDHGLEVVLCSLLPVNDYYWNPGLEPGPKVVSLNDWMRTYAAENDLVYLDYHSAMVDEQLGLPDRYSGDGVHPNKAGYQVMASLAERAIAEVLHNSNLSP